MTKAHVCCALAAFSERALPVRLPTTNGSTLSGCLEHSGLTAVDQRRVHSIRPQQRDIVELENPRE
ncbi:MAG TPA: hypothetical protein VGH54_26840 [Mycobacterium sp.]|uniref:hypothetical protein n=1 Tax=Mycobacterium sp. TaxID=1785 RepID=UPI002F415C14